MPRATSTEYFLPQYTNTRTTNQHTNPIYSYTDSGHFYTNRSANQHTWPNRYTRNYAYTTAM